LKAKLFSSTLKHALAYYNAGVAVLNSKVVGLAPVILKKSQKAADFLFGGKKLSSHVKMFWREKAVT
jgi:hypothetical protein